MRTYNNITAHVCLFPVRVKERDLDRRAELMLRQAARLDCRQFVSPHDVTSGNSKLNMAFVANLFNMHPSLQKIPMNGIDTVHIEGESQTQLFGIIRLLLDAPHYLCRNSTQYRMCLIM